MNNLNKYSRAVIFSGGETRVGVYGGMFEALCDFNKKPELLMASCGGAFSAAIISAFDNASDIKEYMTSREFYSLAREISLTNEKYLHRVPLTLIQKLFCSKHAPYIENVLERYLVNVPTDLEELFPTLGLKKQQIPTVIIGAKALYGPEAVHKKRGELSLYKEVIFTNSKTASLIDSSKLLRSLSYKNSAVDRGVEVVTTFNALQAARISVSDMFYMKPVVVNAEIYTGGAINLVPLELAHMLADEVILELNQSYNKIERAAVESVLGYNPNARLKEVYHMYADHWVDTSDSMTALKNKFYTIKLNLLLWQIYFKISENYDEYCSHINSQWEYGYQRTVEALKLEKNHKKHMRKGERIYNG